MDIDKRLMRFADTYMISCAIGIVMILPCRSISTILFLIGSFSPYLSFFLFCSANLSQIAGIFALVWFVLYPITLVVSYLFVRKRKFHLFGVLLVLDSIVVILYSLHAVTIGNRYLITVSVLDSLVSTLFYVIYWYNVYLLRKE